VALVPGRKRNQPRAVVKLPDLPDEFDTTADTLESGASWSGVSADASLPLPERAYDLQMVECLWRDVDASSRRFSGLTCRDARFERCDFSGAVLDSATLTRVHFVGCRLTGVVLSGSEMNDVVIDDGVTSLANFRSSTSSFLWIRDTSLKGADFSGARLRNSAFLDCDLNGIELSGAQINGLSLHGSILDAIHGASALLDAGLRIDTDQVVPLGVAVVAGLGVTVGPRPTPR
jgi:uncharacterized protein YjbI with pentapeptide repeats